MRCVIGLTGGIGSGKSTVAKLFAELGVEVVDTDVIAHDLTAPGGAAMEPIRDAFGAEVVTPAGALDRAAMRSLVFRDAAARGRLEAILHPAIRAEADLRCLNARTPYVILVVPLLVETGFYRGRLERVLVVDCSEALQVERTVSRSSIPAEQVRAIMAAQASRADRIAAADDVIDNSSDLESLRQQVSRLHEFYLARATAG